MGICFRVPFYIVGLLLAALAMAMVASAVVDAFAANLDWQVFVASAAITMFVGVALILINRGGEMQLNIREGFLLTALSWTVVSVFAALPFLFSDAKLQFADALFEAVSGLTTTGSTVFTGLDTRPPGILLWRSLLEWIGGIGIIVMAIALLPFLRVGGMQLFRMESSDSSEKVLPRTADIAFEIGKIYVGLTLLCAIAYMAAGMSVFDAINHAMATLSTGGFSTSDISMSKFDPIAQWVSVVFMVASGLPFVRYIQLVKGDLGPLRRDPQVRLFLIFLAAVIAAMTLQRWLTVGGPSERVLREVAFNIVSVVTTTGFANSDYNAWGGFAKVVFLMLIFFGACSGSTSGGIKMFRIQIMGRAFVNQMTRLTQPHAVRHLIYDGRRVSDEDARSVLAFWVTYVTTVVVVAVILTGFGLDLETALSGAATAVSNVGPGLGPIIGPSGNFSTIPDGAKLVLSLAMLLGRLELFTVLVLFVPRFWRD